MSRLYRNVSVFCFVLGYILSNYEISALVCFVCAATGHKGNRCRNPGTFAKSGNDTYIPGITKNCTEPYDQICIIQTFTDPSGELVSHIRDCNDNSTFSFLSAGKNPNLYKRLTDLIPNNETACTWDGEYQVCLTKCDQDLCNGPNASSSVRFMWLLLVLNFGITTFSTQIMKN